MFEMEPLTEIKVNERERERKGGRDGGIGRDREREWVREGGRGGKEGWRVNLSFQYSSLRLDQMLV